MRAQGGPVGAGLCLLAEEAGKRQMDGGGRRRDQVTSPKPCCLLLSNLAKLPALLGPQVGELFIAHSPTWA